MAADGVPHRMSEAATALLAALDGEQRSLASRPFADEAARRWLEYRPRARPGACVADMDRAARKAAHRLLATALSPPAYAQAMAVVALEEVLDRQEGWARGRHSDDYWVAVFGEPGPDEPWGWRFEGHHLSVTMTVADGVVSPAPIFLGAHPHRVGYAGGTVLRPLAAEEDLARALLEAMDPAARRAAIVADEPPPDIRTSTQPEIGAALEPRGVPASRLGPGARAALYRLVALYLDRLPPSLAAREYARIESGEQWFAWEGPTRPGGRHYYRVQGDDLLIEYDNTTDDGNHAHTVLRRPHGDFGGDVLAAHRASVSHAGPPPRA